MDNNIKNEINALLNNLPNVSPLEKVRWIYINLGKLFSFDQKLDLKKEISLDSNYIDKYETCVQISSVLNEILNKIDPNIKSEVIERKMDNHLYNQEHLCNIITFNNNGYEEKYLLDLSLDLYRIHFDLKTLEFGYCGYRDLPLDIISQQECKTMDEELGLYKNGYMDDEVKRIKEELSFVDFNNMSFEEEIDYRLNGSKELLKINNTYSESNQFLYSVGLDNFIDCQTIRTIIRKGNEQKYIYIFNRNGESVFYIFDEENNFYKSNTDVISYLLDSGWINNNGLLYDYIDMINCKQI